MFVTQALTIELGYRAAQARFTNLLRGNWLAGASQAAYDDGLTGLLRVGPATPVAAKLVQVRFLDPVYRGDVMTVGLRWEATGPAGSLFPVLDADIAISPQGDGTPAPQQPARLALTGAYRPPLGRLGARLDQAVLHRIATATIHQLLGSVAETLTNPATAGQAAEGTSPAMRPLPEPGLP
jgi:hypothetical protein